MSREVILSKLHLQEVVCPYVSIHHAGLHLSSFLTCSLVFSRASCKSETVVKTSLFLYDFSFLSPNVQQCSFLWSISVVSKKGGMNIFNIRVFEGALFHLWGISMWISHYTPFYSTSLKCLRSAAECVWSARWRSLALWWGLYSTCKDKLYKETFKVRIIVTL